MVSGNQNGGTQGPVSGPAVWVNIQTEKDFDQYKGKLAGKIVFLGEMRPVPVPDKPFFTRYTDKELEDMANDAGTGGRGGPNSPEYQARLKAYMQRMALADKIPQFLADEKALAVIRPAAIARMAAARASSSTTTARRWGASLIPATARSRFR